MSVSQCKSEHKIMYVPMEQLGTNVASLDARIGWFAMSRMTFFVEPIFLQKAVVFRKARRLSAVTAITVE